jgi:hypothetical protein
MPNCWAAACVLRLSEAKRSASALNASVYLRRLSSVVLLLFVLMTQEIYVLLLCALIRPPLGHCFASVSISYRYRKSIGSNWQCTNGIANFAQFRLNDALVFVVGNWLILIRRAIDDSYKNVLAIQKNKARWYLDRHAVSVAFKVVISL